MVMKKKWIALGAVAALVAGGYWAVEANN